MSLDRLVAILAETTQHYRTGPSEVIGFSGGMQVITINDHPELQEKPEHMVAVDLVLSTVGVDRALAERHRDELVALLDGLPLLSGGPSYIGLGAELGDQGAALQLMALGKVLGLWALVTPASILVTDPAEARKLAGNGLLYLTPYPAPVPPPAELLAPPPDAPAAAEEPDPAAAAEAPGADGDDPAPPAAPPGSSASPAPGSPA
jgi:hypothetical protein